MCEIMAPAGSREQLQASVRSGADRVYFGCGPFNARRNAGELPPPAEVIDYCHQRGVKATAALNILLRDAELPAVAALIQEVAAAGGDGLIVQDLAAARLAKEICPELPLHASTQMTVHNAAGVKALESLGFQRVVLARELSLREIETIRAATEIELEVFVHGALCMCVSGCCGLSSALGDRSGNRGLCAQPCRLDFRRGEQHYALSLKDMSYIPHLAQLQAAGVNAFKIEGRMKRPEYAAAAVTAVRAALQGQKPDLETLQAVFSRDGFTDGYLTGKRDASMFGHRTKKDTENTAAALPALAALYRAERQRVPVHMHLCVQGQQPASLTLTAEGVSVTVRGETPAKALNRPLTQAFAEDCLFRCGGTPYAPQELTCELDEGLILPIPALKDLRRRGLEALTERRLAMRRRSVREWPPLLFAPHTTGPRQTFAAVRTWEQARALPGVDRLYMPARAILEEPAHAAAYGARLFAALPALSFHDAALADLLKDLHNAGVTGVQVQNIGAIAPAKALGFQISGGAGLNVFNTVALAEYAEMGLADCIVSTELSAAGCNKLGGVLPRGAVVYGHLPVMRMRACPLKSPGGCGACPGHGTLTDRKGVIWALACDERQYTSLYNPVPLYTADFAPLAVDFEMLQFTDETPAQCGHVAALHAARQTPDFARTAGHYDKPLL